MRCTALALLFMFVLPDGVEAQEEVKRSERDSSFLVPGKTLYAEVKKRWDESGEDPAGPERSWSTEMYAERVHVYFLGRMSILPPEQADRADQLTLQVSPEEAKKWTRISVMVYKYRRYFGSTSVGDPDSSCKIHLVFLKDSDGKPDRLLYYQVELRHEELDWGEVVRRLGAPEDVDYPYVDLWEEGEKRLRPHFLHRRYPAQGVGYVWEMDLALRVSLNRTEAEKKLYVARVHFVPEK